MNTPLPRLRIDALSKQFGGIVALQGVGFDVRPGTVHALLGENGAGKSTLVKIVTGVQPPDGGTLELDGQPVRFESPMAARAAGVVAMYQDPCLFPHLDVAENIFMGSHPRTRFGTVARARMYARARELLDAIDADIDVTRPVLGLSIAESQYVEFARAMSAGEIRVLFLDEPTASLTPAETGRLFALVRTLRESGTAIVYISHRLEEMAGFVDEVTVLRDGRHVVTAPAAGLTPGRIVQAMVGRDLDTVASTPREPVATSAPVRLEVRGLGSSGAFADVSFAVRAGEVVGMAGLVGAGRSEIARTIMGLLPASAGEVLIDGQRVARRSPRRMTGLGLAYVPEDRDGEGLVTTDSIRANLSLASLGDVSRGGVIDRAAEKRFTAALVERLQVKAGDTDDAVSTLSGGNRQKVVIGKWLARAPRVLILDEPTHGIDVGTKAHVHRLIAELARSGVAVLVISSDLPEVLGVSDTLLVMRQGRLVGTLARREAGEERVMALATGQDVAA